MSSQRARIAARAYELWERRGRPEGSPEVDWSAAEKEILRGSGNPPAGNTETTPPDGPIPKRSRRSRDADRQTRGNGAGQ
jgi:hypothetical protein